MSNIIYSIYKATNTYNGKSYVGFSKDYEGRRQGHLTAAFNENAISYNHAFKQAIRKYGIDAFDWEILYQSKEKDHCLEMEIYFIGVYDTYANGYNMTLGGEAPMLGRKQTQESNEKRRRWSKNQILTREQCVKISENKSKLWLVTDPLGNKNIIKNLKRFCKENNLDQSNMSLVSHGKRSNHKGWTCSRSVSFGE